MIELDLYVQPFLYDVIDSIQLAKKYRIGLELLVTPDRYDILQRDLVKDSLKKLDKFSIHGPVHDLSPGAYDPLIIDATRRRYDEIIRMATSLDAKWVVFHLAFNPLEFWHENAVKKWVERSVNFFNNYYQDSKVEIRLENTFERNPIIFQKILDNLINDKIKICLDVGHAAAYSNIGIEEWISTLSPYIAEVHLHNNDGELDQHWPLSEGNIDIYHALKKLDEHLENYVLTLEPINEEDLVKNIEWLKDRGFIT